LPAEVIDRPKQPYNAPNLKAFFRNGILTERARHFLSDQQIADCGLFDAKTVARFLRKFENRVPEQVGYRDNMIMIFLLSAQMAHYWARAPKAVRLDPSKRRVALADY
jgi:asparagine synthase (glutamine-hydrolysing)